MSDQEKSLITRLTTGDEFAFDTIFKMHYKSLCVYASHYTDTIECEEAVQDVMLWLWENRKTLPADLSIKPFLFSAVKNKCLNRITHNQIKNRVLGDLLTKYENFFNIPDGYERGEILDLLNNALAELPAEYREAFEMNRFQNLTYAEIAEKAGVSSKTVAYRISQTLKRLRIVFKDYLFSLTTII